VYHPNGHEEVTELSTKTTDPVQAAVEKEMKRLAALDKKDPLLDSAAIAKVAGVKVQTVWEWKKRNLLPEPERVLRPNRSQWRTSVVMNWLHSTGRLPAEVAS
jgi:predicted DNA-binding transcriptional regulator AlpA